MATNLETGIQSEDKMLIFVTQIVVLLQQLLNWEIMKQLNPRVTMVLIMIVTGLLIGTILTVQLYAQTLVKIIIL